ncbi:MAG: choice-of-anchor A family protein [Desulfarculaceae bacterium]|nr:choice-of-anchor A family protein [Desulfarculaceae bacterium]
MKAIRLINLLTVAVAALALLGLAGPALATNVNLGTAGAYSAFVLHDLDVRYNQTTGAYAVGGDADLRSYTIGYGVGPSDNSLVVGGNLKSNIAPVASGQVQVGGKAKLPSWVDRSNIHQKQSNLPVDFGASQQYLEDLSGTLSLLQTTGAATYKYGGIYLNGDGSSDLQVFNISGNDLSNTNWWAALSSIPSDAHIILNVSGDDISLQGGQQALTDFSDKILFNFYEAEQLAINNITVQGTILAPYAEILTSGATINGQIIAKQIEGSFNTTGQSYSPYSGGGAAAPEPGTLLLLASALGGAAGWGRLRLRRKKG